MVERLRWQGHPAPGDHVSPWVGLYRIKGRGNLKTARRVREAAVQHVPARGGCRRSPPTRADANRRTSVTHLPASPITMGLEWWLAAERPALVGALKK